MPQNKRVVLVVDDDASVLATLVEMLHRAGFEVRMPPPGWTPADILAMPFDLLLTDIRMPVVDGIELIRQVRAARPNTPIIAYSGWLHLPEYAVDRIVGADRVLSKPLRAERLAAAVREVIAQKAADAARS